jgi:hypothetical protein
MPSPRGEGFFVGGFNELEIVGSTCQFNLTLLSEVPDLSTGYFVRPPSVGGQDDGVLNFTAYIAEILIPEPEPHPSPLGDTLSDREGLCQLR